MVGRDADVVGRGDGVAAFAVVAGAGAGEVAVGAVVVYGVAAVATDRVGYRYLNWLGQVKIPIWYVLVVLLIAVGRGSLLPVMMVVVGVGHVPWLRDR